MARLPRKTTWQPAWNPSRSRGFAASYIDTAKPQEHQRLETRQVGSSKTSISRKTSGDFHSWQHNKKTGFAASRIDTARPRENQRLEIRDTWEHQNEHFVRDFLQFWHFAASKSTFSYEFSLEPENLQPQNRCFERGFRQFSAHVTKGHACRGICTLSPLDAALPMRFTKNTQHDTSKVLRLPRKITMHTSKVLRLPRKLQHICSKRHKSIASATQNDFRHVPEHVWMSRSATPATRNEATRRLKPPKGTTYAKLPIGTAIRSSHERLRTVADAEATSSEHTLNPQTRRVKREPLQRIREKTTRYTNSFSYLPIINVTFLIFSLLPPVWLPVVLPRCFTPVCNPIVLPRPCRVEVLEPYPRRVYPVCLPPPWNEKWEADYFLCVYIWLIIFQK